MPIDCAALVARRKELPLSQIELAQRVGLTREGLRKIERGITVEPRPATVRALAQALGLPVSVIKLPERPAS